MSVFATRPASTGASNVHCAPCKFVGNITPATKFCQDCGGHLCTSCVNQHKKGEHTKGHSLTLLTLVPANKLTTETGKVKSPSAGSLSSFKSGTSPIRTASANITNSFINPLRAASSSIHDSKASPESAQLRSTTSGHNSLSPVTSNLRSASASTYKSDGRLHATFDGRPKSPAPVTNSLRQTSTGNYNATVLGTSLSPAAPYTRSKSPVPVTSSLRPASAGNYNSALPGSSLSPGAPSTRSKSPAPGISIRRPKSPSNYNSIARETSLSPPAPSARAISPAPGTSILRPSSVTSLHSPSKPIRNKLVGNPDEVFVYEDHVTETRDKTDGLSPSHNENGPISASANIVRDPHAPQKLDSSLKQLGHRFEHAQKDGEESLRKLEQTSAVFDGSVTKFRKTILDVLDKLEATLVKKKQKLYDAKVEEVQERMKTCQTAVTTMIAQQDKLQTAYTTDDDVESLLSTRMTEEVMKRYDKLCTDIEKTPKNLGFHFLPDPTIEQFFKYKTDMGNIKDDSAPVNVTMVTRSPRNSQDKVPPMTSLEQLESKLKMRVGVDSTDPTNTETSGIRSYTSEDVNVRLPTDTKPCSITGSLFLPADDGLIIADATNKMVKLFTSGFEITSSLEMTSAPRDIASISSTEVAVTLPNDKAVQILKLGKELAVTKIIKLDIECYGISCFKDELYVTSGWSPEKVISVISAEGSLKKKIRLDKDILKCPLYVTIDPKNLHIYVSDYENGIVCVDLTGNVIFRHIDSSTKGFMGITSSPAGEVYVCTLQPNGISRVFKEKRRGSRSDDNHLETIIYLPNKGGQSPRAISFSRRSKKLAVSFVGMNMDSISVYSI